MRETNVSFAFILLQYAVNLYIYYNFFDNFEASVSFTLVSTAKLSSLAA